MAGKVLRTRQRMRTRKALLQAAARLLAAGGRPTAAEVAAEALVSRATVYRYFPDIESLLAEAPMDVEVPDPGDLFAGVSPDMGPAHRVDLADQALDQVMYGNEAQMRLTLSLAIRQKLGDPDLLTRQNRRRDLIDAALKPYRKHIRKNRYLKLVQALSHFFGPESMIICKDVMDLDQKQARKLKHWAIHALVDAALR